MARDASDNPWQQISYNTSTLSKNLKHIKRAITSTSQQRNITSVKLQEGETYVQYGVMMYVRAVKLVASQVKSYQPVNLT